MTARKCRYGAEYDPAALKAAMGKKGIDVNDMAILCDAGRDEVRRWLNPKPGRRMHWATMNRIRAALELSQEEARGIWRM